MSILRVGKASPEIVTTYRDDDVLFYLGNIRGNEILSPEEEIEIFNQIRNGATEEERLSARKKLMESHQRFIFSVAKKYANGNNIMDIVQEANVGLGKAIDEGKFEPNKGTRFLTYAIWYIRREILSYFTNRASMVKTSNKQKLIGVVPRITAKFLQENMREPTPEELLELIQQEGRVRIVDKRDVMELETSSIDEAMIDDWTEPSPLQREFATETSSQNDYEAQTEIDDMANMLSEFMSVCNDVEKEVLTRLYGLGGTAQWTQESIADNMGITKTRVKQIEKRAIQKMRKAFVTVER